MVLPTLLTLWSVYLLFSRFGRFGSLNNLGLRLCFTWVLSMSGLFVVHVLVDQPQLTCDIGGSPTFRGKEFDPCGGCVESVKYGLLGFRGWEDRFGLFGRHVSSPYVGRVSGPI